MRTDNLGLPGLHDKQREFLALLHRDTGRSINTFHAVAGRGSGKTIAAACLLFESCTTVNRGLTHAWTAPTYGMIDRFVVPTWRRCIPEFIHGRRVWTYYKAAGDKRIVFGPEFGGAAIYMLSREHPDRIRGNSFAVVLHDEIGMDRTREAWDIAQLCIRDEAGSRPGKLTHVGISTPRMGWWADEVQDKGNPWVQWTSYDNPWARAEQVEQMEGDIGERFARQEIYADFITLTGAIWPEFVDSIEGNREPGGHQGNSYILAGDLGIHSAWLIIQRRGDTDVITAEYLPNDEGAKQTLTRIKADFGVPSKVIVGQDVSSRWVGDARLRPILPVRQVFGTIPVVSPSGNQVDKTWQYISASGRVCNAHGDRRLKVAADLKSIGRDQSRNARGVLDMFRGDSWPDKPRSGEALPKDGFYEHVRDALLYYCVVQYPPRFLKGD